MFYSIFKANSLKKLNEDNNNFKYDLVIRSRFDTLYEEPIPTDEILDVLNDNSKIYVRHNTIDRGGNSSRTEFYLEDSGRLSHFVADNFSFGSSKALDVYSSIYENIEKEASLGISTPECLLGRQLVSKEISPLWSSIQFKSLVAWDLNGATFEKSYQDTIRVHLPN